MTDRNKIDFTVSIKDDGGLDKVATGLDKVEESAAGVAAASGDVGKALDALAGDAQQASAELGDLSSNTDRVEGDLDGLGGAAGQAGGDLKALGDASAEARTDLSGLAEASTKGSEQAQDLATGAQAAGSAVSDLARDASDAQGDVTALASAEAKAGDEAKDLGAEADKAADGVEDLGDSSDKTSDELGELTRSVNAKTEAIKSSLAVERSEIEVQRQGLELQKTQQQTLLQVAKAKGDEAAATQASNRLREIEAEQLDLVARGKRAEADALQKATDARREALAAVGPLTAAQQKELDVAENTAQAMRTQAAAADESARRVRTLGHEMDEAAKQGPVLNTSLSQVGKAIAGLFAVNQAWDFAKSTVALADAYGQMAERIGMATPIASEYDLVQRRILESANLTYRPLAEQQELYIRTADALRSMGYETSSVLDITDSFSYLLTTNAATVERGASAIDAYTKSIQSGRVEVDSWQSIMSATPTIVDAIAQATGRTAAEVRQLGITGKLSITDLNEGLRQTVDLNKEAASGMSATVKDAVTRLMNTWTAYVGEANKATEATSKIVGLIDTLSGNLDTVIQVAITAGEVMVAVWGVRALTALGTYIASLKTATLATQALTLETLKAASAADKLGAAGKLAAAGWIGWEVGSYLRTEFEVVEQAGIALSAQLTKAFALVQGAWEMVKAAFTDDTIDAAQERMKARLAEIDEIYGQMFADADRASAAQTKAAAATDATAKAAGNAATQWASLSDTYKKVNEDLAQQGELLQKTMALRNAEASTAVDLAKAFGSEAEQRKAQADAVRVQAEQARALAEQKTLELNLLRGEREALAAVGEELLKSDPIKKKELDDLDHKIALREADAAAAVEQARSSEIAAAQASAEAEAMRDNSGRVNELRDAYEKARASLEAVRQAKAAGRATTDELAAAEQAAGRAALVYRDALNDQLQAIKNKADAEAAARTLQEMTIKVAIEHQKAIYEVAKARGDEVTAAAAQNEIRRLEIELLALTAEAKRAEAKAQLAAVEAQRAALIATEGLTAAKKLELDAATAAARVKEKEAEIADITAQKLRDVAQELAASGRAGSAARAGYEDAADGLDRITAASERAAAAERKRLSVDKDGFSADANGNRIVMGSDLGTRTGIAAALKNAGVSDEAAARAIANEFADSRGDVIYENNPGQLKYGGDGSTLSMAVLKAAEKWVDQQMKTPGASTPTIPQPESTRTVTVNLVGRNGQSYGAARTDAAGAEAIVAALEAAARDGGG